MLKLVGSSMVVLILLRVQVDRDIFLEFHCDKKCS